MEAPLNPFRRSFEDSKERRLHLLQTGHLSDCEFLVGDDNEDVDNHSVNEDSNGIFENAKINNAYPNKDVPEVTPNPNEANYIAESPNTIDLNMGNCAITGPKLFRCHKLVLAVTSEVFERMFYGEFDEQPSPIRVTDINPDIFEMFINYIYTYELDPCKVTLRNIAELLYIAEKYMLKDFSKLCVNIIKEKPWELTDVLPMFELSLLYDNKELLSVSQEKIFADAEKLLKDDTFYKLNINFLSPLMTLLTVHSSVKLIQLLTALERYGRNNKLCEDRQAERFVKLVNAACNLNYGEMNAQEYASGPGVSYLFANKYDDVILFYELLGAAHHLNHKDRIFLGSTKEDGELYSMTSKDTRIKTKRNF